MTTERYTIRRSPTGQLYEERPEGLYLIDEDWEAALRFVEETEGYPTFVGTNLAKTAYRVEIREFDGEHVREDGAAPEYEDAWRYALGAHFGSHDGEDDVVNPWTEPFEGPQPYHWIGEDYIDLRDVLEAIPAEGEEPNDEDVVEEARYIKRIFEAQCFTNIESYAYNEPTLIHTHYFEQYAQDFAEDIGAISSEWTWPNSSIDWKAAAEELKQDYTEYIIDGHTYYGRTY